MLKLFVDGSYSGNPGPIAISYLILDDENKVLKEHSEMAGIGTCNEVAYKASISGLKSAIEFGKEINCFCDNEVFVKQMKGEYRIRSPSLRTLWRNVVVLTNSFTSVSFEYESRANEYIRHVNYQSKKVLEKGKKDLQLHENENNSQSNISKFF